MLSSGVRYMLLATFLFSIMNVMVKLLPHLPAVEIAFFRSIGSLALSFIIIKSYKVSLPGNNIRALLLRGFFGASSLIMYFITLQKMPLASAVTLQFLSPIFTTILGIFLVHERVKPLQWVFFAMAFAGVLMIQGFDHRVTWLFAIVGIGSAVFSALAYNTIRMLKESEHPLVIVFYFPLVSLPITGAFTLFNFTMPDPFDWVILLGIGIVTQFAQYFMTRAYQADELSKIASLKYIGIVYALLFGYFFFGEAFSIQVHLGIGFVLVGVVLNIWYRHRLTKVVDYKQSSEK
jgi:drug/metabolite transporter (DMT)-like permease